MGSASGDVSEGVVVKGLTDDPAQHQAVGVWWIFPCLGRRLSLSMYPRTAVVASLDGDLCSHLTVPTTTKLGSAAVVLRRGSFPHVLSRKMEPSLHKLGKGNWGTQCPS